MTNICLEAIWIRDNHVLLTLCKILNGLHKWKRKRCLQANFCCFHNKSVAWSPWLLTWSTAEKNWLVTALWPLLTYKQDLGFENYFYSIVELLCQWKALVTFFLKKKKDKNMSFQTISSRRTDFKNKVSKTLIKRAGAYPCQLHCSLVAKKKEKPLSIKGGGEKKSYF